MKTRAVCVGLALLGLGTLALADDYTRGELIAIGEGRGIYLRLCASCHGAHAQGHSGNPLETPDLTLIAKRDGGFSRLHVKNHLIFGDDRGSAARSEDWNMHRWGRVLKAQPHMQSDAAATLGVLKLVRYLEFIQENPGVSKEIR